jgi:hypothetical protein
MGTESWEAGAGDNTTATTGGMYVATAGGLAGTSGLYSTNDGVNGRQVALTALRVCGAAAGGLATYGSGVTCGAGAIAAGAIGMITTAVQGGFSAWDAQKTVAKLKEIRDRVANPNSARGTREDRAKFVDVLDGCIGKATNKLSYGVANATVVGQPLMAGYRTGRAIAKAVAGQKGVGRERRATFLYDLAKGGGPLAGLANEAIQAICMADFEKFMKTALADAMKS